MWKLVIVSKFEWVSNQIMEKLLLASIHLLWRCQLFMKYIETDPLVNF